MSAAALTCSPCPPTTHSSGRDSSPLRSGGSAGCEVPGASPTSTSRSRSTPAGAAGWVLAAGIFAFVRAAGLARSTASLSTGSSGAGGAVGAAVAAAEAGAAAGGGGAEVSPISARRSCAVVATASTSIFTCEDRKRDSISRLHSRLMRRGIPPVQRWISSKAPGSKLGTPLQPTFDRRWRM